jgi:hypothetical protein
MAEATYSIHVGADGGDAAAGEITKASAALNTITTSSSALQEKFQERFQHMGLQMFASQALGSIGLSGEVRQSVMMMNTALTAAETAAGISSGGLTLLATAAIAVGEAISHVIEHEGNEVDSLNTVIQTQQTALKSTLDNIEGLNAYGQAINGLTPAQSSLLQSEQALASMQQGDLLSSETKQMDAIKQLIASNTQHAQSMSIVHNVMGLVKTAIMDEINALGILFPPIAVAVQAYDLLKDGVNKIISAFHSHVSAVNLSAKATDDLTAQNQPLLVKLKQLQSQIDNNGKSFTDMAKAAEDANQKIQDATDKENAHEVAIMDYHINQYVAGQQAMVKAAQDAAVKEQQAQQQLDDNFKKVMSDMGNKETQYQTQSENQSAISAQKKIDNIRIWEAGQELSLQNAYYKEVELIQASVEAESVKTEQLTELTRQYTDAEVSLNNDAKSKMAAADSSYYQAAKQVTDQVASDVGKSFAQMIVEGKSLGASMQQMFEQMAEQFIEKVIAMAIEWLVLQAVMDIWPGGAAAYTATANAAYPAVSQAAYSGIGNGGAQAEGGTYMVNAPTMFLAGEAGPEIATFTPMSDLNTPSGGSSGTSGRSGTSVSTSPATGGGSSGNITMGDINVSLQLASLGTSDVNGMLQKLAAAIRTASSDAIRFAVTSANLANKNSNVAV